MSESKIGSLSGLEIIPSRATRPRARIFFYVVSNYKIKGTERLKGEKAELPVVDFSDGRHLVEIRIGLSFVSIDNAKANL
jgi:putative alpha-1,2-mannosidase